MPPTRRNFVKYSATLSAAILTACSSGQSPGVGSANNSGEGSDPAEPNDRAFDFPMVLPMPFAHGVASGDPLNIPATAMSNASSRVIIWTRVTQVDYPINGIPVQWSVGTGFTGDGENAAVTNIVSSGTQTAIADRDWTVKVDVPDLGPNATYYYQFSAFGETSIVGRTRTPPAEAVNEIRFAVASCSSYWSSYWSGYGHIADRDDIDLVIHLGDYIYDFVDQDEEVRARVTSSGEVKNSITDVDYRDWLNVDEVRRRYALYRSDPNLCRAHQQHPWTIVWDNHDIDPGFGNELDGSAVDRSGENTTLDQTTQVFWEWTPSRPPADTTGAPLLVANGEYPEPPNVRQVWRELDFGPMVDLLCLDIELDRQVRSAGESFPADHSEHLAAGESLLGKPQYDFVTEKMKASSDAGKTWRVLPHQTWLAPWSIPGATADASVPGSPIQTRWADFAEERAQWFQYLRDNGVNNNIVLSGDMHGNWASDLIGDNSLSSQYQSGPTSANSRSGSRVANQSAGFGRSSTANTAATNARELSVGVEFAPSSMGRGGADELVKNANPASTEADQVAGARAIEQATLSGNKNVQYMEWVDHGYGLLHLTATQAFFEFWWQDKLTEDSPDVLGFQMVTYSESNPTALPSPRYVNQVDDVLLHGLTVAETSGSRTAALAPTPDLDPR